MSASPTLCHADSASRAARRRRRRRWELEEFERRTLLSVGPGIDLTNATRLSIPSAAVSGTIAPGTSGLVPDRPGPRFLPDSPRTHRGTRLSALAPRWPRASSGPERRPVRRKPGRSDCLARPLGDGLPGSGKPRRSRELYTHGRSEREFGSGSTRPGRFAEVGKSAGRIRRLRRQWHPRLRST